MVRVKICGIKTFEDARYAVNYGAHALGFVFCESRRRVDPLMAREIIRTLPPFVMKVGVFMDQNFDYVLSVVDFCGLDAVQLHGAETPQYCSRFDKLPCQVIKAFRVKDDGIIEEMKKYRADAYLLDSWVHGMPGGTGKTFDWSIARKVVKRSTKPVILAGGLNDANVAQAVMEVSPYAVDVSSGVETFGKKDKNKIIRFMNEVRRINLATA